MPELRRNGRSYSGGGGSSTAKSVSYDNTASGLESTNVQGAIDELINTLGPLSKGQTAIYTISDCTVKANSNGYLDVSIPDYDEKRKTYSTFVVLQAIVHSTNATSNCLTQLVTSSNTIRIVYHNYSSSTTLNARIYGIWV